MTVPWRGATFGLAVLAAGACSGEYPSGDGAGGEPVVPEPCSELGRAACEADQDCRWLVPGCGERPLPREACFPAADCRQGGCAQGFACVEVVVDPCGGYPCGMPICGVPTNVCITPQHPCDGAEVGADAVCRGLRGEELPVACCRWDCDTSKVMCRRAEPSCLPGERPSVVNACYGPCVPEDRCLPTGAEALCAATGGRWDPWACGHHRCGVPNSCEAIIPGCDCGPTASFEEGRGCVESESCRRRCDLPQEFCIMASSCRYYVPGCGDHPLPEPGCHPATDCRDTGCGEGEVCRVVSIDPCADSLCTACGRDVGLCLARE